MFELITKTATTVRNSLQAKPAERKPPKARVQMEALEDRMVPAYTAPTHTISVAVQQEISRGDAFFSQHRYGDARESFKSAASGAVAAHDVDAMLRLSTRFQSLGELVGQDYGDFGEEKELFNAAYRWADFFANYKYGDPDSGSDRLYGIEMLEACVGTYDNELMGLSPGEWDLKPVRDNVVHMLNSLKDERFEDILGGQWQSDDGDVRTFPLKNFDVRGDVVHASAYWPFTMPGHETHAHGYSFEWSPSDSGNIMVYTDGGDLVAAYHRSWVGSTTDGTTDGTTGKSDIDLLVDRLNQLSNADAVKELWKQENGSYKYSWDQVIKAFDKMDEGRVAQIIMNFATVEDRATALSKMTPGRAANIAWKLSDTDWTPMIQVLAKMEAKKVAELVWNYSSANMVKTLQHMSDQRAAEVFWNIKDANGSNQWGNLKSTFQEMRSKDGAWSFAILYQMPKERAADFLANSYRNDVGAQVNILNGMNAKKAADVIWSFKSWKEVTDVLVKMPSNRIANLLWSRSYDSITNTLREMNLVNSKWPWQVLEVMPADRVALLLTNATKYKNNPTSQTKVLNGLTALKAAQVIRSFKTWKEMTDVLANNSVARAAEIVKNFDPAQVNNLLAWMSASQRTAIKAYLGW